MTIENIFAKITDIKNLELSWQEIKSKINSTGIDDTSVQEFDQNIDDHLTKIKEDLEAGVYVPKPVLEYKKYKGEGNYRQIIVASIIDRIIQKATSNIVEPISEKQFYQFSYAYRKKRGQRNVIELINKLMQNKKFTTLATGDIRNYFENIDHEILLSKVKESISDNVNFINLLKLWLKNDAVSESKEFSEKENGLYQGYIISPVLANLYLNEFDHYWNNDDYLYLRYADNFIFLTKNRQRAEELYRESERYLQTNLNLILNEQDYQLSDIDNGFTFLGILFKGKTLTISAKKLLKAKKKIRSIINSNEHDINKNIEILNKAVYSWRYYYSLINQKKIKTDLNDYIIYHLVKKLYELKFTIDEILKIIDEVVLFTKYSAKKAEDTALEFYKENKAKKTDTNALIKENRKFYKKDVNLKGEWLVLKQGTKISLNYNQIVMENQHYKTRASLDKVTAIQIGVKNNSITTNLIEELAKKNIPVYITDTLSRPVASIIPAVHTSLGIARKQIEAFYNNRARYLAKEFIIGKIKNQQKLLTYYAKYWRKKSHRYKDLFDKFKIDSEKTIQNIINIKEDNINKLQNRIMGEEGSISSKYWQIFSFLILPEKFTRDKKSNDKINVMLNYGYGILYHRIHTAIIKEGLNPQISYLHSEQRNKPTLVYDIIEQFRAPVVERTVITIVNNKQIIETELNTNRLTDESRKILAKAFLNRLHSFFNYKKTETSFAEQINERVKIFSKFLTAEKVKGNLYKSFIMKS